MLKENFLLEKLNNSEKALGTWNVIPSVMVVDVIASTGIDFIIIDCEHGSMSYETAYQMVLACEANGVSPIMRVATIDQGLILRALDLGIHGIQLPNIVTVEDAKKFVEYAKYPPIGNRGFSPYTRAGLYDFKNGSKLPSKANDNVLLIANIEGPEGISNIEDIIRTVDIDVYFIGLFDLSKSLGIPGEVDSPVVIDELKKIASIIKSNGKKVGTIASNTNMLSLFKEIGIDYITYSVDTGIIKDGYQEIVDFCK